jgi:hypothetical protein
MFCAFYKAKRAFDQGDKYESNEVTVKGCFKEKKVKTHN